MTAGHSCRYRTTAPGRCRVPAADAIAAEVAARREACSACPTGERALADVQRIGRHAVRHALRVQVGRVLDEYRLRAPAGVLRPPWTVQARAQRRPADPLNRMRTGAVGQRGHHHDGRAEPGRAGRRRGLAPQRALVVRLAGVAAVHGDVRGRATALGEHHQPPVPAQRHPVHRVEPLLGVRVAEQRDERRGAGVAELVAAGRRSGRPSSGRTGRCSGRPMGCPAPPWSGRVPGCPASR